MSESEHMRGRVTIPTDVDVVPETLELLRRWGADAIRDCDGTDYPEELKSVDAKGAVIDLGGDTEGYLRASEISAERVEDATTKLAVGDTVEAQIISVDRKNRSIQLSIKAKDAAEAREALDRVNSDASSGTTNLGALLKAKLEQK